MEEVLHIHQPWSQFTLLTLHVGTELHHLSEEFLHFFHASLIDAEQHFLGKEQFVRSVLGEAGLDTVGQRDLIATNLLLAMHSLGINQKFLTTRHQQTRLVLEEDTIAWIFCLCQRITKLVDEMRFGDLVRVQFDEERIEANLRQSLLYHFQRSTLLSYEEHTLPMVERVCNHVGDSLALTGSRRTIEQETLTMSGIHHRLHLTAIRIDGKDMVVRRHRLIQFTCISSRNGNTIVHTLLNKTLNHWHLAHLGAVGVDVVPHHKLGKGEETETDFIGHTPSFVRLTLCTLAECTEDGIQSYIDSIFRNQLSKITLVVLLE